MTESKLKVTQADRDAAAELEYQHLKGSLSWMHAEAKRDRIAAGEWDQHPTVQAFARHRITTAREVESLQARVRELEDLPRLIELEREGTCDDAADEAWNRALSRAATMVRATLKETSHAE